MESTFFETLMAGYEWKLSIATAVLIFALTGLRTLAVQAIPVLKDEHRRNVETYKTKMKKAFYAENQAWNRKWSVVFLIVIFGGIIPFTLTLEPQPWWQVLIDMAVILMVYDFFYYLTHRFVFHDNGFFGGPLVWMHAVHHRQHNPCRNDSSFIHPLEIAIGLGLYVAVIFFLSLVMGRFHMTSIVVTWLAFSLINLHNHTLWESDRFPFRYLKYASAMHHNHHAKFTGGNYATITLLFDWMFGTLDDGHGWGKHRQAPDAAAPARGQAATGA